MLTTIIQVTSHVYTLLDDFKHVHGFMALSLLLNGDSIDLQHFMFICALAGVKVPHSNFCVSQISKQCREFSVLRPRWRKRIEDLDAAPHETKTKGLFLEKDVNFKLIRL